MISRILIALAISAVAFIPGRAQTAPPPPPFPLDMWKGQPPFSFTYAGKSSSTFLATWQKSEAPATASEGGETDHYIYTDPVTKLKITADVRTYTDFPAVDWVLHFSNGSATDTPIIEDIQTLAWTQATGPGDSKLHYALGDNSLPIDFQPQELTLHPGASDELKSSGGCSSHGNLPFFNLETGGNGIICGIGWSGDWKAEFARDKTGATIGLRAGMQKTHFLLHPGETIRTPRILILNWKGTDWLIAQNIWRRLMLAHYSPKDSSGQVPLGPVCNAVGGETPIDQKLLQINAIHDWKLPVDVYWVDAGWYGDYKKNWQQNMGTWTTSPVLYPHGLKPLGDAVKQAGMRLLLWMMPEIASEKSAILVEHPDWFLCETGTAHHYAYMLDAGSPKAWKGLVELVSNTLTDSGASWFRNDYPTNPASYWPRGDTPDRVGMTEIRYIEGFYDYWDELLKRHPGLLIDDCSMRQDIETMPRSFDLWRTDMTYGNYEPTIAQMQTQGLSLWEPLSAGVFVTPKSLIGSAPIYRMRSCYSAAIQIGVNPKNPAELKWFKPALEEYRQARPYFYGDFYPMLPYSGSTDGWTAWQWDRPDRKSGIFLLLRRKDNPHSTIGLTPHALDPEAKYAVEIRTDFVPKPARVISGAELKCLQVDISDKPGSALVFYKKL